MNKSELINEVAKATGLSKADVDRAIKGILWNVSGALAKGERVTFVGFGTFQRRHRRERIGVNPQNPTEKITIPAKEAAVFVAGSELKETVETGKVPAFDLEPIVKKAIWTKVKDSVKAKVKAKSKAWAKPKAWVKAKSKIKAKAKVKA